MDVAELGRIAGSLDGVREASSDGMTNWRYRGRLIARQLDNRYVVIRTGFAARDALLARSPDTFSVPRQFAKHMMIVADLVAGDDDLIEDALRAAWALQASHG